MILSYTGSWHHEVHPWSLAAVKFTRFLCSMSEERLLDCYKETMQSTASNNIEVVGISCNSNLAGNTTEATLSSPSAVDEFEKDESYVLPVSLAIAVFGILALISLIITAYIVIYYLRQRRKKPQR